MTDHGFRWRIQGRHARLFWWWDVWATYKIGDQWRDERFAGGFWTKRGARRWIAEEERLMEREH